MNLSRRQFATGLAATGLSLPALLEQVAAQGAASPATRNLPKTYSGRTLKIVWGNSPAFISTAEFSKVFTTATGVQLEFSQLPTAERYQKMAQWRSASDLTMQRLGLAGEPFNVRPQIRNRCGFEAACEIPKPVQLVGELSGQRQHFRAVRRTAQLLAEHRANLLKLPKGRPHARLKQRGFCMREASRSIGCDAAAR